MKRLAVPIAMGIAILGSASAFAWGGGKKQAKGFYEIILRDVSPAASPTAAPTAVPAAGLPEPYLTIIATADLAGLQNGSGSVATDLKLLKLDAKFNDPLGSGTTVSTIAVYDIKSAKPTQLLSKGEAILKSYPVRVTSNQPFNVTFESSAIEENLASKFLNGLSVLNNVIPAGMVTPGANQAMTAASKVLATFQSPQAGTSYSVTLTLNVPAGQDPASFLSGKPHALVFVPTGGSADKAIKRKNEAREVALKQCSGHPEQLCTDENGADVRYDKNAYVLLTTASSFRISRPTYLWTKPAAGSCTFGAREIDAYVTDVSGYSEALTTSQRGLEEEFIGSVKSLTSVRGVSNNLADVLDVVASEWTRSTPTEWLYGYNGDGLSSYQAMTSTVRKCILREGELKIQKPKLLDAYSTALSALYAKEPTSFTEYDRALRPLASFKTILAGYHITDSQASGLVDAGVVVTEATMIDKYVDPWIASLADAEHTGACRELTSTLQSSCGACREKARRALEAVPPPCAIAANDARQIEKASALAQNALGVADLAPVLGVEDAAIKTSSANAAKVLLLTQRLATAKLTNSERLQLTTLMGTFDDDDMMALIEAPKPPIP